MDKVKMLKQFYSSMDFTQIKLECTDYDFAFVKLIEELCTVDYVEMRRTVHKYRLRNVPLIAYDYFLKMHIEQHGNVCGYFDKTANNVFCFNLDAVSKDDSDTVTFEMQAYLYILREYLQELEIVPLIVQSGRGFHVWCRVDDKVPNEELVDFMIKVRSRVKATIEYANKLDVSKVHVSCYPRNSEPQTNSLRLVGSTHVRTKEFSKIIHGKGTEMTVVPVEEFWEYLDSHRYWHTVTLEHFRKQAKLQNDVLFSKK